MLQDSSELAQLLPQGHNTCRLMHRNSRRLIYTEALHLFCVLIKLVQHLLQGAGSRALHIQYKTKVQRHIVKQDLPCKQYILGMRDMIVLAQQLLPD